jgi:hypothetical protein
MARAVLDLDQLIELVRSDYGFGGTNLSARLTIFAAGGPSGYSIRELELRKLTRSELKKSLCGIREFILYGLEIEGSRRSLSYVPIVSPVVCHA